MGLHQKIKKLSAPWVAAVVLAVLAVALLWTQNAGNTQAVAARSFRVGFDGEYRIADGPWQRVVAGKHISATQGDVTLRGRFHIIDPYTGELLMSLESGASVTLYFDHISCTITEPGHQPYISDAENPAIGADACGRIWTVYTLQGDADQVITVTLHNPHRFGNETAVDDFLDSLSFDRQEETDGAHERTVGFAFILSAFAAFGIALFSAPLRIPQGKQFWQIGTLSLFAGAYFIYSMPTVSFWNWSTASNTTLLGLSMMFYTLSGTWAATSYLEQETKCLGKWALGILCAFCCVLIALPIVCKIPFYDTWLPWAAAQSVVCLLLIVCLIRQIVRAPGKKHWICVIFLFSMAGFLLDVAATALGWWQGGVASKNLFVLLYVCVTVYALRNVPRNILAKAKAEKMEVELQKSRMAIMMSQIRPHFIYNTLGSIEQLCLLQPEAAASLVHNFARYLRGNFSELDNPSPIHLSQEMEHVRCYVSIEKVRFPDISVEFDLQSDDFMLPALSVQPLVENAIKHGLMRLPQGGIVTVSSFESPSHYCVCVRDNGGGFDSSGLWEDKKHIGLRNIRERLQTMCEGTLTVESTPGVGTKVTISIPKEGKR